MQAHRSRRGWLALAVLAMFAVLGGCRERERWPDQGPERPRPRPRGAADYSVCPQGGFCLDATPGSRSTASDRFPECQLFVPLPRGQATELPPAERRTARVVFAAERTAEERKASQKPRCCYRWFLDCV